MNNLNAPLGVHIPRLQIIQHSAQNSDFFIQLRNWEHWVATSLFILSLTQLLSVCPLFLCMYKVETIWRRSVAQQ